ncbi:hypothetical protein [Cytobacillus firmus]|uniref:hypothetical protein n=1 Tax=Cytobacillus firmus TaxID=1399 RepID=UPI0024943DDD|nr:hypothetical protein [Cytobacillus firmus]
MLLQQKTKPLRLVRFKKLSTIRLIVLIIMDDTRNEKEENQLLLRFERNPQIKAYALTSFCIACFCPGTRFYCWCFM